MVRVLARCYARRSRRRQGPAYTVCGIALVMRRNERRFAAEIRSNCQRRTQAAEDSPQDNNFARPHVDGQACQMAPKRRQHAFGIQSAGLHKRRDSLAHCLLRRRVRSPTQNMLDSAQRKRLDLENSLGERNTQHFRLREGPVRTHDGCEKGTSEVPCRRHDMQRTDRNASALRRVKRA